MRNAVILLLTLIFVSCAVQRPSGKTEAEILYREAKQLMSDNRYILATEKLNTLRSQYPYSYFATSAELLQADILFNQESFEESAAAYILFKDFHPKNKKMDYVIFKIAESYYMQIPTTFDRDLSPAVKAISYFNELRSLYPNSALLKDAQVKIKKSNGMLLDKEKYIAHFYFKTEDYESAKFRYTAILADFNEIEMQKLASSRLIEIGLKTNDPKLCRKIYPKYKSLFSGKEQESVQSTYFKCIK